METIIVLSGMFALAAGITAWLERKDRQRQAVPAPDRSTEREGARQNRQQVYIRRMERQS